MTTEYCLQVFDPATGKWVNLLYAPDEREARLALEHMQPKFPTYVFRYRKVQTGAKPVLRIARDAKDAARAAKECDDSTK